MRPLLLAAALFWSLSCAGNERTPLTAPVQGQVSVTDASTPATPTQWSPEISITPTPTIVEPTPVAPPTQEREAVWAVYDPDPQHLWNRLFRGLFRRTTADGAEYGHDSLDPLLWFETTHLLAEPSHSEAIALLDELLSTSGENLLADPIKQGTLQRDLWAVFDWLTVRSDTYPDQREALKSRLALAIRRLALTKQEIQNLPDNYEAAVESGKFPAAHSGGYLGPPFLPPSLLDAFADWINLGRDRGPMAISHVRDAHFLGRSAFLVLVRVPGGREATRRFVEELESRTAQDVSIGTEVALVRRMMLIDDQGAIVPSRMVEAVQLRHFISDYPEAQVFHEFALDRRGLFSGEAGGLQPVEREFLSFSSHEIDVFDIGSDVGRHRATVPTMCRACHAHPSLGVSGIQSIFSYSRAPFVRTTSPDVESQAVIDWKLEHPSWLELQALWNKVSLSSPGLRLPASSSRSP